ncbi:MAG: hypothetical protein AAGG46_06550 [Planctomycetota bacterium]
MVNGLPLPTENLARLIGQKRQVLVRLHEVGRQQQRLVESGDVATLLKLLAAKQRLLAALQQVERQLAPHHAEDPEQRVWPSPKHRAACAAEAAECSRLLSEVMEMEKSQESVMVERRDNLAGQLRTAHAAHAAHAAYQTHAKSTTPDASAASQ